MPGWIKMPLGRKVGLGQSDIVLDGNPAPLPKKGDSSPQLSAHVLWPNGWIKVPFGTEVSLGGIVFNGDAAPSHSSPPIFGPCLLWPNGWMDQDETWHAGKPRPWPNCVS